MCVIIDNSVRDEVFKPIDSKQRAPAREFFRCINKRNFPVVAGGKLLAKELSESSNFRKWWQQAVLSGRGRKVPDDSIEREVVNLQHEGEHLSNDLHILALARVSGARLLYTNDRKLQQDFKNKQLISNPPGRIYTTLDEKYRQLRPSHKRLLGRTDLCRKLR